MRNFAVGDEVLVIFPVPPNIVNKKLSTVWKGPFRITKILPNHVIEIKSTSRSKPQIVHTNRVCLFNHLEDVIANSEDKIQEVEQQDIPAREDESKQVHFTDDDDNDDDDDKDYHNEDDINDVNPIQPVQLQQPQPDTNSLNQTPICLATAIQANMYFRRVGWINPNPSYGHIHLSIDLSQIETHLNDMKTTIEHFRNNLQNIHHPLVKVRAQTFIKHSLEEANMLGI